MLVSRSMNRCLWACLLAHRSQGCPCPIFPLVLGEPMPGRMRRAVKGVSLPHGTELRMEYNGRVHTGRIEDGRWMVEGRSFNSPSAAAGGGATTKNGKHPSLDGWIYWQARLPGEHDWIAIAELRRRAGMDSG